MALPNCILLFLNWNRVQAQVKYTTLSPCTCLSESDLKLYNNFESCLRKNHRHFKNTLINKAKQFMLIKIINPSLPILEDGASCVQVGTFNT